MEQSPAGHKWITLAAINLGNFVTPLDTGIMAVVLPTIVADLGGIQYARLVLLIPLTSLLVQAAFMPVFGRFSDRSGRKKWFVIGLALFSVGAVLAGGSSSIFEIIIYRVVQSVGGALILANGRALIADAFKPAERGVAYGFHISTLYLGVSVGVLLTASVVNVTNVVGWRYAFYVSGLLAAAAIPLSLAFVKESPRNRVRGMDWVGALLFVIALGSTLTVITQAPAYGLGAFSIYVQDFRLPLLNVYYYLNLVITVPLAPVLAVAAASAVLFLIWERRTPDPLLDFGMLKHNSMFLSTNLSALLLYTAHWGTLITLSFYLEEVEQFGIFTSGLLLVIEPVSVAVTALVGGWVASRTGSRDPAIIGMVMAGVALGLLATLTPLSTLAYIAFLLAMLGVGVGIFAPANTNANIASVKPGDRALANGVLGMMRFTGQSLSIAIGSFLGGSLLLGQCFSQGCAYTPSQATSALDIYFAVGSVLCLVGALLAFLVKEQAEASERN